MTTAPAPTVWPTFRARHARGLIRFLVDAFGFTEAAVYGEGDRVEHAELRWPEGGGVILENADFVITQPSSGEFKAFSKICTHQGCPVTEITSTIDCRCHGSKFSITDGSVVNGPATEPLAESKTTVTGGKVYVDA